LIGTGNAKHNIESERPSASAYSQPAASFGSAKHSFSSFEPRRIESTASIPVAQQPRSAPDTEVIEEIRSMRQVIVQQLSHLAWDDTLRRRPLRIKLLQAMLDAGFSATLARYVTEKVPDDFSPTNADMWLKNVLAKNINVIPFANNLVDSGGAYALVGPTGVGKTTTVAKLAARGVVKFGANKVGLITTDNYRIGAQDQLRIYGKILGVPVQSVQDESSLANLLAEMRNKHLVIIDTVGMGQRDTRVAEQATLFGNLPIKRVLLLNTTSQLETLEDVVGAYQRAGLHGAILTKLDEAVKLGGALDILIRFRLALHCVTDGQRVPEDLHYMEPMLMLQRALKARKQDSAVLSDEEYKLIAAAIPESQASALAWA
jgi:flagellar biosynthesis protein FlhF